MTFLSIKSYLYIRVATYLLKLELETKRKRSFIKMLNKSGIEPC